jgi:hypothetical protein
MARRRLRKIVDKRMEMLKELKSKPVDMNLSESDPHELDEDRHSEALD